MADNEGKGIVLDGERIFHTAQMDYCGGNLGSMVQLYVDALVHSPARICMDVDCSCRILRMKLVNEVGITLSSVLVEREEVEGLYKALGKWLDQHKSK